MIVVSVYDLNNGEELERKEFAEWGAEPINYYYRVPYALSRQGILADALIYDEDMIILGFGVWRSE